MSNDTITELYTFFRAGYPALSINTAERVRAGEVVKRAGWRLAHGCKVKPAGEDEQMLAALAAMPGPVVATKEKNHLVLDAPGLIARYDVLSVSQNPDEDELAKQLGQFLNDTGYSLITWDTDLGFSTLLPEGKVENTQEFYEAMMFLRNPDAFPKKAVFLFFNCHSYLNHEDPRYRTLFSNLVDGNKLTAGEFRRHLIFLQPYWQPHNDITHAVTPVEFLPPDDEQLNREVDYTSSSIIDPEKRKCPDELRWDLVKAMRGLSTVEAANTLAYCVVKHRGWVPETVPTVHKLTAAALAKDEVLEVIPEEKTASGEQIGGFENYMEFIAESRECYKADAINAGLRRPKGCLLLGIPGCVADDTVVSYRRGKRPGNRELPINVFHDKFNGVGDHHPGAKWKDGLETYLQSFDAETGKVFYNRVVGVYAKGRKRCVKVTTRGAGGVTLTYDHPVLVEGGTFKPAGEIELGHKLLVRGSMLPRASGLGAATRRPRVTVEGLKHHANGWKHEVKDQSSGKVYVYQRMHRARLVVEAHLNGLPYEEFVDVLKSDPARAETFFYLESCLEVHHLNEDPTDDRLENLMVMTKADHTREHADEGRFNVEYTREDDVVRVEDMGDRETYDVSMEFPYANFVVNDGVVVHNTGKSTVAMATARLMRLPLIKYDFGAVFNALIGQSEATQRQALRRVSARGPCVLLIDEADKAFSGIVGSSGDSGVGQRVFGRLLTWMANENENAFVIMTMNRIVDSTTGAQIVPIETLRAGRIETTFYTTFPDPDERKAVLTIHLVKNGALRHADHAKTIYAPKDWEALVAATHEYVGSELEQVVIKAVRRAFVSRKELTPTFEELMDARTYITPVAKLDDANIKAIDRFCKDRAVPVSRPKKAKMATRTSRSLNIDPQDN